MKLVAVLFAAVFAANAVADCREAALLDEPSIPSGVDASLEEMKEARDAVADFVRKGEAFLSCYEPDTFQHNYIVTRLENTASAYNAERQRFVEQRGAIASN